ncbi:MAG TPA: anthranilate synthase component I [Epulopiscium sp.]|nr:anthranilate synthase component I [Candidatus Epulonipiscium sp.]
MKKVPYVKTVMGDTETPITVFQKYVGDKVGFLLESKSKEKNRFSFIGTDPKKMIQADNKNNTMAILKSALEEYEVTNTTHLPFMGGAVGIISYEQSSHFFLVTEFIAYDHDYGKILFVAIDSDDLDGENRAHKQLETMYQQFKKPLLTEIGKERDVNAHNKFNTSDYTSNMSKPEFIEMVNKAKQYIQEGEVSQIVISQRWEAESNIHPFKLYRNLRSLNPSPYLFYFNFGDYQIVGSSPEMLVEIKNEKISNCPLAGTRKRGKTEAEDNALAKELLEDPKEVKEHIMLVDLGKEDMALVAKKESIQVNEYMKIQKYSHVMHIGSLVQGEKRKEISSLEVLNAFFPAGTLTGYPRTRAMEIIDELEKDKRGFYGGTAGYIGFTGDMDMCIAIRMMVVKNQKIYMQAGAGIVADSVAEKEYEESENKVKALINAVYMGRD